MKRFLAQLKTSIQIDAPRSKSGRSATSQAGSSDESISAVDQRLGSERPATPAASPGLHASIMNAVAGTEAAIASRTGWTWLAWPAAGATAAVVIALLAIRPVSRPEPGPSSGSSLADGVAVMLPIVHTTASNSANAVTASLETELRHIQADIGRTTDFFLASLP